MGETEQGWVDQAQYDLETAKAMLSSGRHLYVLFCCQQAVEKALKAIIVRRTGELPPRVHNLLRLAEAAQVQPSADQSRFLGELSAYYIQSRYPEEIKAAGSSVTRSLAEEVLRATEKSLQWVLSMLE
jgi:HEPN domain-containing protein